MQNLYDGSRILAWADYIFSLQGFSYDLYPKKSLQRHAFVLNSLLNEVRESRNNDITMAHVKCTNEECGLTFNVDVDKCPFCGSPCEKVEQTNKKTGVQIEGELPFPIEIVGYFGAIYSAFATDGKIKLRKVIIISLAEALIGVVITILGWPLLKGGLKNTASFFFIIPGMAAVIHAFYSLVKYYSLNYWGRKKVSLSESSARWIIFLIEFVIGATFAVVSAIWITSDWGGVPFILGIGLLFGGICSIIKYYRHRKK